MSRKAGIVVSLVLALLFTALIVGSANKKYNQAVEKVQAVQVTEFIPAGAEINDGNTKAVEVVKSAAGGLASVQEVRGIGPDSSVAANVPGGGYSPG
ncbi:MAG: hypothetical protein ACPLRU_03135, partial [Desulfofundulus sp.]